MTQFHLFSQNSVSLPSNGWEPWLETAPTGGVRKSYYRIHPFIPQLGQTWSHETETIKLCKG